MKETKAEQTTDTVIFHHKRITCPTVSAADAIVEAAAKLNQTIQENMKESLTTLDMNELDRLAKIFQEAAQKVSENDARQPRVPRQQEDVATPRVTTTSARDQHQYNTAPRVISQEEDTDDEVPRMTGETDGPRYMTRNQKQVSGSIATDVMLTVMQLSQPKLNAQKLVSRKYPLEMLCEFANAVMDDKTGDMLEYRQLIK
jgi:ribosomal protein S10